MYKNILAAIAVASLSLVHAKLDFVSVDGMHIMQQSKEGKSVIEKMQKKINAYQEFVNKSQKELVAMQEEIQKKAAVLSAEALQEKTDALAQKKKDLEHAISTKEEALRADLNREQTKLRDKQFTLVTELSEKKEWGVVVDKNAPGVYFTAKAIDKTDEVLAHVNDVYDKAQSAAKPADKKA